jgi:F0F1-type ATP synthase assembly protein I
MQLDRDSLLNSGRYLALGFQIGGSIVGGLLLGYFLDDYLHTAPLFTLLLTIGGFIGALRVLLWSLKKSSR